MALYVAPFGYYNPCGYIVDDCEGAASGGGVYLPGLRGEAREDWLALVREGLLRRDYPQAYAPEARSPVADRLIVDIVENETAANRDTSAILLRLEMERRRQPWRIAYLDRLEVHRAAFAQAAKRERRRRAMLAAVHLLHNL